MRRESRPNSDYTRTWSASGEIEYIKLGDGPRLRYLEVGSGPTALLLLRLRRQVAKQHYRTSGGERKLTRCHVAVTPFLRPSP